MGPNQAAGGVHAGFVRDAYQAALDVDIVDGAAAGATPCVGAPGPWTAGVATPGENTTPSAPAASASRMNASSASQFGRAFGRDNWSDPRSQFSFALQPQGAISDDQDDCGAHLNPAEPLIPCGQSQPDQSGQPKYARCNCRVSAAVGPAQFITQLSHACGFYLDSEATFCSVTHGSLKQLRHLLQGLDRIGKLRAYPAQNCARAHP